MLTVKKCKKILEDNSNKNYSDEKVIAIREFLYRFSKVVIETKEKEE